MTRKIRDATPAWTSAIPEECWYKVIATKPDGSRFNVWHCASRDQADEVIEKWTASTLNLRFEIHRMREWLYLETLDHIPGGLAGFLARSQTTVGE